MPLKKQHKAESKIDDKVTKDILVKPVLKKFTRKREDDSSGCDTDYNYSDFDSDYDDMLVFVVDKTETKK